MTEIVTPSTEEWIIAGKPTPAFIQYLEDFKTSINSHETSIVTLTASDQSTSKASITASGALEAPTDDYLDTDGDLRTDWVTPFGLMFQGTASNADIQNGGYRAMGRIQSLYNRQKLIIDRQNELEAALIEAGLLENT